MTDPAHGVVAEPRTGRTLLVSRSAPPGVSGSARVLAEIISASRAGQLAVVGASPIFGKHPDDRVLRFRTELSFFGRGARYLAWARQTLLPLTIRRLAALAAEPDITRVVCVFPDAFYCHASLAAAQRVSKPISFYFHNTYADNRRGLAGSYARRLEEAMMSGAERLYFISDALREHFTGKYPFIAGKSETLPHPVKAASAAVSPRGFASRPVRATMMGNLNQSNFDAARRFLAAFRHRTDMRIAVFTPVPRSLLIARGMDLSGIDYRGYVSDDEIKAALHETDLFLLPHGIHGGYSNAEYRTIFPTRAAYYLAQGRPILVHCPSDSGLQKFFDAHDCGLCVTEPSEEALVGAFEKLESDQNRQLELAQNALATSRLFDPSSVLTRLLGERGAQ